MKTLVGVGFSLIITSVGVLLFVGLLLDVLNSQVRETGDLLIVVAGLAFMSWLCLNSGVTFFSLLEHRKALKKES